MKNKTVIYFDQNDARRLMLELTFKGQPHLTFYTYKDFSQDSFRLLDLNPDLVILDQDQEINFPKWVLGKDVLLPFSPLELKSKVLSFIR